MNEKGLIAIEQYIEGGLPNRSLSMENLVDNIKRPGVYRIEDTGDAVMLYDLPDEVTGNKGDLIVENSELKKKIADNTRESDKVIRELRQELELAKDRNNQLESDLSSMIDIAHWLSTESV